MLEVDSRVKSTNAMDFNTGMTVGMHLYIYTAGAKTAPVRNAAGSANYRTTTTVGRPDDHHFRTILLHHCTSLTHAYWSHRSPLAGNCRTRSKSMSSSLAEAIHCPRPLPGHQKTILPSPVPSSPVKFAAKFAIINFRSSFIALRRTSLSQGRRNRREQNLTAPPTPAPAVITSQAGKQNPPKHTLADLKMPFSKWQPLASF
jgi:hypothetical protein